MSVGVGTVYYNFVLEITRLHSFISGNTKLGTRHLYGFLPALHLQCMLSCSITITNNTDF
jgi:hypothetical protein